MERLPDELISDIFVFITDIDDLYSLIQINCKYYYLIIDDFLPKLSRIRCMIRREYPIYVKRLFDDIKIMAELPELQYMDSFYGPTKYMDNINPEEVKYPIMTGIDDLNRLFIIFKLNFKLVNNISSEYIYYDMKIGESIDIVMVYHQTNNYYLQWIISTKMLCYKLFINYFPTNSQLNKLSSLIKGDIISTCLFDISLSKD